VTIMLSAIVSLTLVPMMCAKVLRHVREEDMNWFMAPDAECLRRGSSGAMASGSIGCSTARPADLLVALLTMGLTVFLYVVIPKGFFPVQDTGLIQGISEAPPASFLSRRWPKRPGGARRGDPQGSRRPSACRRFIGVRGHQRDAERRPLPDQSKAARRARA